MILNRKITNTIRNIFDDWIPPAIRDSRWFMKFPLKLVFKNRFDFYSNFKREALQLSEKEYSEAYEKIDSLIKNRDTDLNRGTTEQILSSISGNSVLDVGCGKGYLAIRLSEKYNVTALDMVQNKDLAKKHRKIKWAKGNVEMLPFGNKSFDTVVCAHTLEHVLDIHQAIKELKRVAKKRLIVVVPKQRSYYYTFDLHLHFFPYSSSLQLLMGRNKKSSCTEIDGDLFYVEDRKRD